MSEMPAVRFLTLYNFEDPFTHFPFSTLEYQFASGGVARGGNATSDPISLNGSTIPTVTLAHSK